MTGASCALVSPVGVRTPDAVDAQGTEPHLSENRLNRDHRVLMRELGRRTPDTVLLGADDLLGERDAVRESHTAEVRSIDERGEVVVGCRPPHVVHCRVNHVLKSCTARPLVVWKRRYVLLYETDERNPREVGAWVPVIADVVDGVDVDVAMPALSTYLGHVKVTDTYWYVTGIPDLMNTVSRRFERFFSNGEEGDHELN